jgi:ankyrin repeat protein
MFSIRQSSLCCLVVALALSASACAFFWEHPGTPLGQAAHRGDLSTIHTLIAGGSNPNEFDATGQTALHWATRGGHEIGPHRCLGEDKERLAVINALIESGADINATDRRGAIPGGSSGWTPLHIALHHEQFITAARLLELGANPNIRSHQGKSIMEMAAEEGAPKELLAQLLERGFDPRQARTPVQ